MLIPAAHNQETMTFPVLPEGIESNLALPLPWQPVERRHLQRDFLMANVATVADREALRNYQLAINKRYIITGIGIRSVEEDVTHTSKRANLFGPQLRKLTRRAKVLRRFDQDVVGLEPDTSDDKAARAPWEGSADDFTGSVYDTKAIAELVGTDAARLNEVLSDERLTRHGYVILRAANYLAPVACYNEDNVLIGDVTELTRLGEAITEVSLSVAERHDRL